MAVTEQTLRLEQQLRDQLDLVTDAQVRELVSAWATAWDEVAPDLQAALLEQLLAGDRVTRAQLLRSTRLRGALAVIAERLADLADQAGVRISRDLQAVVDAAGGAQASVIDSQLPPRSGLADVGTWARVDERQIEAIVSRSSEQITSRLRPMPAEQYEVVRRELVRGVASGSNPRQTAARMVRRAEGRFNGGLTRALNIARTETLDAHRNAAMLGQAQQTDVLGGWSWLAKLDTRTCGSCWGQHGSVHPLEDPGPLDHQQGRCARMPVVKTWAELGFDIEEPASLMPDAEALFDGLSVADQKAILGPSRYEAYAAGEFPMSAWSQRRTTPGWRDSFGVASAPQSGGRRSPRAA